MWVIITLAATSFQILRTSEQHRLRSALSVAEAGYVRYLYALPPALVIVAIRALSWDPLPTIGNRFWWIVVAAGFSQIVATIALLQSFRVRDFAVGTVYAKAEVMLVAVASALLINEAPSLLGWVGVVVVFFAILWLASMQALPGVGAMSWRNGIDPAALLGLAAGGLFALTSIGIRAASNVVDGVNTLDRALITLVGLLSAQVIMNGIWLAVRPNESIGRVVGAWRPAVPVGLLSLGGSACWAWAIALEGATKVRTLGQVELVLAFAIGIIVHKERHSVREYLAGGLIVAGIIAIVLS